MKVRFDKKRGKKPWCLDIGTFAGKRQREYFESEKQALAALKSREKVKELNGWNALQMPVPQRQEYIEAEKRLQKIGWTITQAVLFVEAHGVKLIDVKFSEAAAECVKSKIKAGNRQSSTDNLRRNLAAMERTCGNVLVNEVTREQVEKWAHGGESLATARSRLIDANTFFNFCLKRKWCVKNPVAEIEKAIIGYLAPIYFGGLRPAESQKLTKDKVHADVIEVEGTKAKTRRRRFVPLNDTLKAWLSVPGVQFGMSKRSRALQRLRWILSGKKTKAKRNHPKQKERIVTGFPWPHDVMRHSFCSYALPKYGATKTAEWAGHSEQILFAHYRERVKPDAAEKFWALRP